ncbi:hypothetical protein GCM10023228_04330 [Brevibacillus fulvus]
MMIHDKKEDQPVQQTNLLNGLVVLCLMGEWGVSLQLGQLSHFWSFAVDSQNAGTFIEEQLAKIYS